MANYCRHCGKQIPAGGKCSCGKGDTTFSLENVQSFMESMKNQMGFGDPELNKGDAFEKGKRIIPDCVEANEGEIPVKQYRVATLRNRILGITYAKAVGRLQVTNKRVIFRAPGKCLAGRTTLQHEFAIDELAGVEARREYTFNLWDLIIGAVTALLGGAIMCLLINLVCGTSLNYKGETAGTIILTLLLGLAGCVPFFLLKKKWLLKLLCLGGSLMSMLAYGSKVSKYSGAPKFFGGVLTFLGLVALAFALITLFVYAIKPNLVLVIKTRIASESIDISRKKLLGVGGRIGDHTGYAEVIPAEDAERCIREINAVIKDIQERGDAGIEKWKSLKA